MDRTMHSYLDLFIQKLGKEGHSEEGVNLQDVGCLFTLPN